MIVPMLHKQPWKIRVNTLWVDTLWPYDIIRTKQTLGCHDANFFCCHWWELETVIMTLLPVIEKSASWQILLSAQLSTTKLCTYFMEHSKPQIVMMPTFITGGNESCRHDNLLCHQWGQSWHHDGSAFSGSTAHNPMNNESGPCKRTSVAPIYMSWAIYFTCKCLPHVTINQKQMSALCLGVKK